MNHQNIIKSCILCIDIQTDQCYDNNTTKRGTQSATIQQADSVGRKENTNNVRIILDFPNKCLQNYYWNKKEGQRSPKASTSKYDR